MPCVEGNAKPRPEDFVTGNGEGNGDGNGDGRHR